MIAYDRNKILTFYHEAKECLRGEMCPPRTALVYPSRGCNQNCFYCSDKATNADLHKRMMDTELLLSLPARVKQLGCEAVETCGGGEPFMHPQIDKFIQLCNALDLRLGALTNGTFLRGDLADLVLSTFSFVRISIDSMVPETYNKMRGTNPTGPAAFEPVLENIKYLVRKKAETGSKTLITLKAVFSKINIDELPEYIQECIKLKVDGVNIKAVRNVPEELSPDEIDTGSFYLNHARDMYNPVNHTQVFGSLNASTLKTPMCFACNFHIFIDTDGSLRLCCYYQDREKEHTYGNIKDSPLPLASFWYGDSHKSAVKNIDTTKCNTYSCKYHGFNEVLYEGITQDKGQWQFT